jgi:hypothetical protein
MSTSSGSGDRITSRIDVGGDFTGQAATGKDIEMQNVVVRERPTPQELADLHARFEELERTVKETAPDEQRDEALDKVAQLEAAVTAEEPDLPMMEHVRNWFRKHAPGALGAVVSVIVNPVVGKLVAAGGDALAAEFARRFEGDRMP